jgi:F-type H+-transporting ATPase subunit b
MEEIFKDFGVQPVLLAAQAVNFLILLFILKRFLYKPLLKVLEERKAKVAKSLKDAEEIERRLQQTVEDQEKFLNKASREAQEILETATKSADQIISEARLKASQEMEEMVLKTQQALKSEREKLSQEVRLEVADLITLGFEKISGKALSKKDQEDLVKKSVRELNNETK